MVGSIFIAGILGINRLVDTILDDEHANETALSVQPAPTVEEAADEPDAEP